jgi:transcriptional regulator with XRE-family HTH domain
MVELLDKGLSLAEVGHRFGVSKQSVYQVTRGLRPKPTGFTVRCQDCGASLDPAGAQPSDDQRVFCVACLERRPAVSFAERLKTYRLAAGLRVGELEAATGVSNTTIFNLESGRRLPRWPTAEKLFRALGVRLVYGAARDGEGC